MTVLFEIGKDGKVLNAEIFESSGHRKLDAEAIALIQNIDFEPLPEWYRGESLTFRVDMDNLRLERVKRVSQ